MWSLEWWGFVLAMGFSCSILGINVAHELGHRPERHNQLLSQALLTTSLYTHFFIEHNQGHHRNVATKEDPGTARRNEWLQVFWFQRCLSRGGPPGRLKAKNMRRKGLLLGIPPTPSSAFKPCNGVCLRPSGSDWAGRWRGLLIAGLFGGFLLEVVNYVEHYGLERNKVNEHRYERVMPHHSWNSDHPLGRLMLFELTRHSTTTTSLPSPTKRWIPSKKRPAAHRVSRNDAVEPHSTDLFRGDEPQGGRHRRSIRGMTNTFDRHQKRPPLRMAFFIPENVRLTRRSSRTEARTPRGRSH